MIEIHEKPGEVLHLGVRRKPRSHCSASLTVNHLDDSGALMRELAAHAREWIKHPTPKDGEGDAQEFVGGNRFGPQRAPRGTR